MIQEFYYGTSWTWPIEHMPRIMLSASFLDARKSAIDLNNKPYMVDSGVGMIFSNRTKRAEKRIGIERYAELIIRQNPPIAWTLDYPCEPSIRKEFGYSATEAQIRTNENTIYLRDELSLKNVMSVVQGWEISDYARNLERIKEQGLETPYLGIGSVCRRGYLNEIVKIIKMISSNSSGNTRKHAFGIKKQVLQTEARYYINSADSHAWAVIAFGRYENNGRGIKGRTIKDKLPYLLDFVNEIEDLVKMPDPLYSMEVVE